MTVEKTSTTLSMNHKKLNDRIIEMERNVHKLDNTLIVNASKLHVFRTVSQMIFLKNPSF